MAWAASFLLYHDPETHASRQVESTRTSYTSIYDLTAGIQPQVKNNRGVELTDADLDNMYIHRDSAR